MGTLEGVGPATRAIAKPLSRKSIKPKRLFQTPEQIRQREAEKAEEATTDIEDEAEVPEASADLKGKARNGRQSASKSPAGHLDALRLGSGDSSFAHTVDEAESPGDKTNPSQSFTGWRRVKSQRFAPTTPRGRKRSSSQVEEEGGTTKKLKNR